MFQAAGKYSLLSHNFIFAKEKIEAYLWQPKVGHISATVHFSAWIQVTIP